MRFKPSEPPPLTTLCRWPTLDSALETYVTSPADWAPRMQVTRSIVDSAGSTFAADEEEAKIAAEELFTSRGPSAKLQEIRADGIDGDECKGERSGGR